jgi:hypothetical protein
MIDFDALFPQDPEVIEGGGGFPLPPDIPLLDVPSFDVSSILLDTLVEIDGVTIPPIPGVIVIPGNIAFLNQRIGTHRLEVTIKAKLSLPDGRPPVDLQGKAFGTVLVRHPKLSLSINHPDVVRAGETYSVFVTIHNIQQDTDQAQATPANLVRINLDC